MWLYASVSKSVNITYIIYKADLATAWVVKSNRTYLQLFWTKYKLRDEGINLSGSVFPFSMETDLQIHRLVRLLSFFVILHKWKVCGTQYFSVRVYTEYKDVRHQLHVYVKNFCLLGNTFLLRVPIFRFAICNLFLHSSDNNVLLFLKREQSKIQ